MKSSPRVPKYLRGLNPEQLRAVRYGIEPDLSDNIRPLLVIAGAGTGKTNVLVHRVTYMIERGSDPRRILLLAFSRRAVEEMKSRVLRMAVHALGRENLDLPWSGTFHSIGASLLRLHCEHLGLRRSFTILDRSDSEGLMGLVRENLGLARGQSVFPNKEMCLRINSLTLNTQLSLGKVLARHFPGCVRWNKQLRRLFKKYAKAKQRQNLVDYDDLLVGWLKLMKIPDVAHDIRSRFDHVFVDEYQDTNCLQVKILFRLRRDGTGITAVGDDAQAIYSFRGASVSNILDFPEQCRPRAKIITLQQNYRSNQPILKACNKVIGLAKQRYVKELFSDRSGSQKPLLTTVVDEGAQARYVADQILGAREQGVPLKQQAVLFRASNHSVQLETELAKRNIPFRKFGGSKFLEMAHIKDFISLVRWYQNPRDQIAGARVLQLLPRIGPATATKALKAIKSRRNLIEALSQIEVPKPAVDGWAKLLRLLRRLRRDQWPEQATHIRKWYEPLLRNIQDDAERRLPDVIQLEQIANHYESREQFLTEMAIDPPDTKKGPAAAQVKDEDYVVLSTIHSAKGQEYQLVKILNVVAGCIPSDQTDDIEEERRLLHVAMTRARNELDLVVPLRFFRSRSDHDDGRAFRKMSPLVPTNIQNAFERQVGHDPEGKRRCQRQ